MVWAALIPVAAIVVALIGVGIFAHWLDKPHRDLVAEIKKRPAMTIHLEGLTYRVEQKAEHDG